MKICCTKMKRGKNVSMFLPMVLTFLATQHWLHGLLFMMLGGSMASISMNEMAGFQRVMIVLTLVTVLWSVYDLCKDGFKHKGMIVMTSFSTLVGLGYVMMTVMKMGW